MRRAALLALLGCACAPTALAPSVIRLGRPPLAVNEEPKTELRFGLRSSPRIATAEAQLGTSSFAGTDDAFHSPPWSIAWDFQVGVPLNRVLQLHAGLGTEVLYGIPFPALSLMLGVSALWNVGPLGIAPALSVRGGTDFGLAFTGPSGSIVAFDFSPTLSGTGDSATWLGLTPFVQGGWSFSARTDVRWLFAGAVVAMKFNRLELSAGFGRAFFPDGRAWTVPLVGLRVAE